MSESVKPWPEERVKSALESAEKRALDSGGEPPDNGDMGARIEKLESFAERTGERLTRLEEKLDYLIKEVGQFKWWLVATLSAIIFTVIGTSVGIQQMTVATFQAAAQQAGQSQAPSQPPNIIINVPPTQPASQPSR